MTGTWQGLLQGHSGSPHKEVLVIEKQRSQYKAIYYSLDDGAEGAPVSSISVHGRELDIVISHYGEKYIGTISQDGKSILGTWTDSDHPPRQVSFDRATKATAWMSLNLSAIDLKVVAKAASLLNSAGKWNREDNRECPPQETKYSLYCSLEIASQEVRGNFEHRDAVAEEARAVIDHDLAPGNHYDHRLMGYNNDPKTSFADVQRFYKLLASRIRAKIKHTGMAS